MITLEPSAHRKLLASLRLLGSDKEGERQAALNAALRLLPPGVTLADLVERPPQLSPLPVSAAPEPVSPYDWGARWFAPWRSAARKLLQCHGCGLTDRERTFLRDIMERRDAPTPKQALWLDGLSARFGGEA